MVVSIGLFRCSVNSGLTPVKNTTNHGTRTVVTKKSKSTESNGQDQISAIPEDEANELNSLYEFRILALEKNVIGKEYTYDFTGNDDCNKTRITYLGTVNTDTGKQYKLVNSFYVTGVSCRGISRLVVYDEQNRYIGNYYLNDLPIALEANELVYPKSTISFKNGLPKSIYDGSNEAYFQSEE